VAAFGVVWLVRVLLRLHVAHRHLATDAAERITIAKTFLAMRERAELNDDLMVIIAHQLFRQAPSGLVKGEDMPRPLMARVADVIGK
jgi:hypothetical protein